ncbi:hypothetical protein DN401_23400 [Bacillus sp. BF2-3]|uniref:hypothetical protein n=1 Tax=Bacillus cereus group TaxID=86661 RepID=UPI0011EBE643|nr:hypothetical protein [Bacillus sp. BF2-3]KAA0751572.1 hypothetical protein DN401_23400 [Bacillus sp. BF2-3]
MIVGDIIVVSGKSLISKMIQKVAGSKWTHVALYIGGGYIIEIDWNTKSSIVRETYSISNLEYMVLRNKNALTKEQQEIIISTAVSYQRKGFQYDWLRLISLYLKSKFPNSKLINKLDRRNKFICTELVDEILKEAGIDLFPNQGGDIFPHDYLTCEQLIALNKVKWSSYKKAN